MAKGDANKADDKGEERPTSRFIAEIARQVRKEKGLTQEALGKLIGYTGSAVSAMETGAQPVSDQMLERMEEAIGDERGIFEMARKYIRMEKYPVRFGQFAPIEASAYMLSSYQTVVVDGLFQTEPYARAVIKGSYPPVTEEMAEALVQRRMARKVLFDRDPTAMIQLIVDESVLRRPFGSWTVQREQLDSLVRDGSRDNVSVQVLPLSRGLTGSHAGERGPMKLVETKDHDHVVYMENEDETILISDRAKVGQLAQRYAKIRAQALSPDDSLCFIKRLAGEQQ
ncbi:helix-turn-helix transcriptional regulator [Streptomyces sp. NPDC058613]|uniref:helix-turn-helix domain-containing protein n=1 Tax=unclassified Streptomyces TaxID=2593676 RepID=UPI00364BD037